MHGNFFLMHGNFIFMHENFFFMLEILMPILFLPDTSYGVRGKGVPSYSSLNCVNWRTPLSRYLDLEGLVCFRNGLYIHKFI